jgi:hypothetical protein
MKLTELLIAGAPNGLHLVATDESRLCDLSLALLAAHRDAAVRTIRGRKSRTKAAFFDESAAVLQFPYYFGENWDAFDEVFGELQWVPARAYVLLFSSADELLVEATGRDFEILLELLADQHDRYAKGGVAFHSVLQCAPDALAAFTARLSGAKAAAGAVDPA